MMTYFDERHCIHVFLKYRPSPWGHRLFRPEFSFNLFEGIKSNANTLPTSVLELFQARAHIFGHRCRQVTYSCLIIYGACPAECGRTFLEL